MDNKKPSYVHVVYVQSEASEDYFKAFKKEPTDEQILDFQTECYRLEYGEKPEDEYFVDLMGHRSTTKLKVN